MNDNKNYSVKKFAKGLSDNLLSFSYSCIDIDVNNYARKNGFPAKHVASWLSREKISITFLFNNKLYKLTIYGDENKKDKLKRIKENEPTN